MKEKQSSKINPKTLKTTFVICTIATLFDIIYSTFIITFVLFWVLVSLGLIWSIKKDEGIKGIIIRVLIPSFFLFISLFHAKLVSAYNRNKAGIIVEKCKNYGEVKGECPATLDDLVPNYMKSVPVTGNFLNRGRFIYRRSDEDKGRASLMWRSFMVMEMHLLSFSCVSNVVACCCPYQKLIRKRNGGFGGKTMNGEEQIEAETVRRNAFSLTQSTGNRL